ncbi:hypothetical protein TIFTF001_023208 [Ficus carica]|uniref:Uncharacterized protein n=1 Tax=Ficus carica TaxID=3494 RepID=A0AA88DDH7_FICCA|nr:hypothetical protein TIFTF001_023208 [Ficus carica]
MDRIDARSPFKGPKSVAVPASIERRFKQMEPNKYCLFHCEIGHLTSKCYDLKDEIKDLIRRGCLQEYRHDRGWESDHRE